MRCSKHGFRSTPRAGDVVLLGAGWLDVSRSNLQVRRVPDLAATLSGGICQLAAGNWIVVPEPYFRNPGLTRLQLVHRVHAQQTTYAGHSGYDYEVYIPPRLPAAPEWAEVALDDPQAAPYLGSEWVQDRSGRRGLPLPASGASIFLPPLAQSEVQVEFEIVGRGAPFGAQSPNAHGRRSRDHLDRGSVDSEKPAAPRRGISSRPRCQRDRTSAATDSAQPPDSDHEVSVRVRGGAVLGFSISRFLLLRLPEPSV